jgi:cytochrome b
MSEKLRVWDLPVRVFHWLLAASFAGAHVVSESERLRGVHVILGYTTLGLIAFRVMWGFVGPAFARFRSFLFSPIEELHEICANLWLGAVIVHIFGVILGSWLNRENLTRAMIIGYKQGVGEEEAKQSINSASVRVVGVCLAMSVVGFWIWGLLTGSIQGHGSEGTHEHEEDHRPPARIMLGAGTPHE